MHRVQEKVKFNRIIFELILLYAFFAVEFILYTMYLTIDVFFIDLSDYSKIIKYLSIVVCFIFALIEYNLSINNKNKYHYENNNKDSKSYRSSKTYELCNWNKLLVVLGLFFTLIADWNLLINNNIFYGLCLFIIIQQIYTIKITILNDQHSRRLGINNSFYIKVPIIISVSLALCGLIIVYFSIKGINSYSKSLVLLGSVYFVCLLRNAIYSVKLSFNKRKNLSNCIFSIGMILFLFCDINVGIYNIDSIYIITKDIPDIIYRYSYIAIWFFYLPSQVCIALSLMFSD